jgi:hypothetical protein
MPVLLIQRRKRVKARQEFNANEIERIHPNEKVGLLATVNPEGRPHLSLITSLLALDATHMAFGEFSWGLSKWHVRNRPETGFLIMTLDRKLWRGKARWTHLRKEGDEYGMFNDMTMFRYNTYFGINTVHYLDLVETTGDEALPMGAIIRGALSTKISKGGASTGVTGRILNPLALSMFNSLGSLKFLCHIGSDGYPAIIPVIQCQAADSRRLAFSLSAYGDELKGLAAGTEIAVYALTLQMENLLVRGVFGGFRRYRGITLGTVDINWVYNSMPPVHGQIYPEQPLTPVVNF